MVTRQGPPRHRLGGARRAPRPEKPRGKSGIIAGLVIFALMVGAVAVAVGLVLRGTGHVGDLAEAVRGVDDRPISEDPSPVVFVVRPGSTANDIGQDLRRAGLIRSAVAFRVQAELRGVGARLGMGEYELRRNMRVGEILDTLSAGTRRHGRIITIPEGWRSEEIAQHLENSGVVKAQDFLDIVAGREPLEGHPLPDGATSFEGYLFPDSYDFGDTPTAQSVARMLIEQFDRQVDAGVVAEARSRGLSLHQALTLASIVEREAQLPEERSKIAAVFHNRMERGMRLDADPTTQYALVPFGQLLSDRPYWKTSLTPGDLAIDSPYNTYRVTGLPPAPIANPGIASIRAAASPADGPWLYFVARGDGSHVFSNSLGEHERNVAAVGRTGARPLE